MEGVGFQLGLNLADVSMNSSLSTSTTTGFAFGGTYDLVEFAPDVAFVPGARFIQRGFGFDVGMTEVDLKISYLEFPMMFRARFRGANVIPFAMGGPVLGLKLGTSCSVSGGSCTIYDDGQVKAMHMGVELGGGVLFPLENGSHLLGSLRYHLGVTSVSSGLPDPRHRGLLIEAGYQF